MVKGHIADFIEQPYGIILGQSLAYGLGLNIGDKVSVIVPKLTLTPFGAKPRVKQFRLVATFSIKADMDSTHAYIRLQDAQRLFALSRKNTGEIHRLRYLTQDVMAADRYAQNLQASLEKHSSDQTIRVIPWSQQRLHLFQAVKMEKLMVGFMLSMVIAVAAFNLISVLSMMVADKRNEVSVLRMMGLSRFSVLLVFLTQGLSLTLISVLVGGGIGITIAMNLTALVQYLEKTFGFYIFDPTVFYISGLPSKLMISDVYYVVFLSVLLSFLFVLYPAYRATRISAVEALQYQ